MAWAKAGNRKLIANPKRATAKPHFHTFFPGGLNDRPTTRCGIMLSLIMGRMARNVFNYTSVITSFITRFENTCGLPQSESLLIEW
jgi:hypothetical protein